MDIPRLLLVLAIGTAAMLIPIMLQGSWYGIKCGKRLLIAVLLTVTGTLGTFLLYYIENGEFGGISFFGAVFLIPVVFVPIARMLKIQYDLLMDLCAPAECMMLVVMKMQCYLTGCCGGAEIRYSGIHFVFPSQLVELANALILCVILLLLSRKEKSRGKLHPWYLVLYGISRFVLNVFRRASIIPFLHMPYGNFWSLIVILIGIVWLIYTKKKQRENYGNGLDEYT